MGDVVGATRRRRHPRQWRSALHDRRCCDRVATTTRFPATGGLFGSMTLINVLKGEDFGLDPTALDGFSSTPLWFPPGDVDPTLALVNPKTSVVVAGFNMYVTPTGRSRRRQSGGPGVRGPDAQQRVQRVRRWTSAPSRPPTGSCTFPTKRYYMYAGTGTARKLFQSNFTATGSCDDVVVTQYDREERTIVSQGSFSPPPPTQTDSLCWEANVITRVDQRQRNVGLGRRTSSNMPTDFVERLGRAELPGSTVRPDVTS